MTDSITEEPSIHTSLAKAWSFMHDHGYSEVTDYNDPVIWALLSKYEIWRESIGSYVLFNTTDSQGKIVTYKVPRFPNTPNYLSTTVEGILAVAHFRGDSMEDVWDIIELGQI